MRSARPRRCAAGTDHYRHDQERGEFDLTRLLAARPDTTIRHTKEDSLKTAMSRATSSGSCSSATRPSLARLAGWCRQPSRRTRTSSTPRPIGPIPARPLQPDARGHRAEPGGTPEHGYVLETRPMKQAPFGPRAPTCVSPSPGPLSRAGAYMRGALLRRLRVCMCHSRVVLLEGASSCGRRWDGTGRWRVDHADPSRAQHVVCVRHGGLRRAITDASRVGPLPQTS